jgi:hypothetical protein
MRDCECEGISAEDRDFLEYLEKCFAGSREEILRGRSCGRPVLRVGMGRGIPNVVLHRLVLTS